MQGNTSGSISTPFDYLSQPQASDINAIYTNGIPIHSTINLGYWSVASNSCTSPGIRANAGATTTASLKIVYERFTDKVNWYEQPSGGTRICDSSIFNPLTTPNNIINNSNTLGTYTFYGACESDTNCRVPVNLTVGELKFTNVAASNVSCNGGTDGSITVVASGSSAPISYSILPITGTNSTGQFSNLAAGTYTIRATSTSGCIRDTVVTILEPTSLNIGTMNVSNVLCKSDSTGSVTMMHNGGTGAISYLMFPSHSNTIQATSGTFLNLPAGTYTAIGTDANGCSSSTIFTIVEPATDLQITNITSTTPSCTPGCDGTITITSSGGVGSLLYSLGSLPGQNNGTFNGLCSGLLLARVTDANGCFDTSTVQLINPIAPTIDFLSVQDIACNGDSTGNIFINASGGTGALNYSTNPNLGTLPWNNIPAGNYTITIADANSLRHH